MTAKIPVAIPSPNYAFILPPYRIDHNATVPVFDQSGRLCRLARLALGSHCDSRGASTIRYRSSLRSSGHTRFHVVPDGPSSRA